VRALRLRTDELTAANTAGRVLAHDLGPGLRKGTVLGAQHLEALRTVPEVHVIQLDEDDVHEDDAARRLGAAIAGPGTRVEGPVQSQVRLLALRRGLVRVDREGVEALNQLPAVGVFTLVDGQAVNAGEEVAGAKVTPVAIAGSVLDQAERLAAEREPIVRLDRFRPLRTLVVVTERLKPRARALFAEAVTVKLGWYGAELLAVREVARSGEAVRDAYEAARKERAEVVLFAGASSIDPLDAAYSELEAVGGEVLRQGAPSHPGSMLWLGRLDRSVVLGVASCAGFGKNTALDLVLPFIFAYGEAGEADFRRLGYGGLVETSAGRRFPPYT
jgi:hypothetical protein